MPHGEGGAATKLAPQNEAFQGFLGKLDKVDFSPIVRYLQREDKNHWTEDKALSELENFKAFFALRGVVKFLIVPTKDIDEVWHACILHTEFYVDLCTSLYGKYIHHLPSDGTSEAKESSRINFKRTATVFSKLTGRPYMVGAHGAKCCSNCSNVVAKASDHSCGISCEGFIAKSGKLDAASSCGSYCSTCDCY